MRCVTVRKGRIAIEDIPNSLSAMQKLCEGYIQTIGIGGRIILVCNEEGKLLGLEPTARIVDGAGELTDVICGNFFICRILGEEFTGLKKEDAVRIRDALIILSASGLPVIQCK